MRDHLLAAYAALNTAPAPILHPSDAAADTAVINAFERQTIAHPELLDNWLLFAVFNCPNVPSEFLIPSTTADADTMTPLTRALLPAASVVRAPHIAQFKAQVKQYLDRRNKEIKK